MSKSKQAGTWAETAVVNYLRGRGRDKVERRTLQGTKDRGDIAGVPGLVLEVKNEKSIDLAGYLKELLVEVKNEEDHTVDSAYGAVVIRKRGTTDPSQWYAVLPFGEFMDLWDRTDPPTWATWGKTINRKRHS